MTQAQALSDFWIEAPKIDTRVHMGSGALIRISTGKAIPIFRNTKLGTIIAKLPKNDGQPGLGKGKFQQAGRVVLAVLQGGAPGETKKVFTIPKDGNKWNLAPSNLEWMSIKEHTWRRMVTTSVPKMDALTALAIKGVTDVLAKEKIHDYDAIGSVFGLCGRTINSIAEGKSWGYVEKFIKAVSDDLSRYRIAQARDAVNLYQGYDLDLNDYMVSYEPID